MSSTKRRQLILKGVLLIRKVNRYSSKEEQIDEAKNLTDDELQMWIDELKDERPEWEKRGFASEQVYLEALAEWDLEFERSCCPSCTGRDYSPGNPWDAPGMSISDFI